MDGKGGGGNLPVCRIFRKGIDASSSFSPRSGEAELVQPFPLQVPHAAEQSNPCFFAWTSLGATVRFKISHNNL